MFGREFNCKPKPGDFSNTRQRRLMLRCIEKNIEYDYKRQPIVEQENSVNFKKRHIKRKALINVQHKELV